MIMIMMIISSTRHLQLRGSFSSDRSQTKAHGGLGGEGLVDLIDVDILHLQPRLRAPVPLVPWDVSGFRVPKFMAFLLQVDGFIGLPIAK